MNSQLQIEIFEGIAKIACWIFFFQENCSNFLMAFIIPDLDLLNQTLCLKDKKSIGQNDIFTRCILFLTSFLFYIDVIGLITASMLVSFHLINWERKFIMTHVMVILIINITYWRTIPSFLSMMILSFWQRILEFEQ